MAQIVGTYKFPLVTNDHHDYKYGDVYYQQLQNNMIWRWKMKPHPGNQAFWLLIHTPNLELAVIAFWLLKSIAVGLWYYLYSEGCFVGVIEKWSISMFGK